MSDPLSILTVGRRAVWQAIDNWPALQDVFKAKFRGEGDMPRSFLPGERVNLEDGPTSQNQLPAISILPATLETEWILNQLQQNSYGLAVILWTDGWGVTQSEYLWQQVIEAIFKCKPPGSPRATYVNRTVDEGGTGHNPQLMGGRMQRGRIGTQPDDNERHKTLIHTFGIGLKLNMQAIVNGT